MTGNSKIEWTEQTWNPIVGCSIVSPGCTNCYAMQMASRIEAMGNQPRYAGTTKKVNGKAVWTGKLAQAPESVLLAPLKRKKPTTYFVNSMGDLFHEDVPDEWIDKVFAVMALCPQHTFQVLTKRAQRLRDYCLTLGRHHETDRVSLAMKEIHAKHGFGAKGAFYSLGDVGWHYKNIWLGVSAERQQEADERIPHLAETPAAVRFVSIEPLLGPINLFDFIGPWGPTPQSLQAPPQLDWVIVGGESGPNARPMHPDWARSLRDQCTAAGVPYFFKQWGEWLPGEANRGQFDPTPMHAYRRCDNHEYGWPSRGEVRNFGTHPDRFSGDLHTRRVGKKAAGRLLDGIEHNAMPERSA